MNCHYYNGTVSNYSTRNKNDKTITKETSCKSGNTCILKQFLQNFDYNYTHVSLVQEGILLKSAKTYFWRLRKLIQDYSLDSLLSALSSFKIHIILKNKTSGRFG